jgi:1,4-alpha-glucan branching enzyme
VEVHVTQARTAAEQLWYKDAIIYQLHVKSFFDSNNDGIGDFPGLISKLDYIADLGVNAIWVLPFYPSPLLDDGYDISGYRDVHPEYGALDDFRQFVRAVHARDIRVITDLEINHAPTNTLGFSEPGGQSQDRHGATSMFGPTMTKSTPARASSSLTRNAPIGPGIQLPARIIGIASSRTSPT